MFIRLAFTFLAMFAFQLPLPVPVNALEDTRLPGERDIYFKHYAYTRSEYLHLRPDGRYRKITREHFYVKERDLGKWEQNQAGDLLLKSDLHYHNIIYGDLFVSVWHRNTLGRLPDLKQRIQHFLKDNRSAALPAKMVERIRERTVIGDSERRIGDISVLGIKRVKRSDLEGLLLAIDDFIASDAKNVFALKPLRYKSAVIFVDEDSVSLTKRVLAQELAEPPHPAYTADKHGYQEIEAVRFAEETKETQPFLFFPELNKRQQHGKGD